MIGSIESWSSHFWEHFWGEGLLRDKGKQQTIWQSSVFYSEPPECNFVRSVYPLLTTELVTGRSVIWLSPRGPAFNLRQVRVGFVVDKLAISEVFLTVRLCSPVSKNQVMLHTHVTLINDSRCATLANVRIGK